MIEILRSSLMESLEDMAARGHLLVVGEPGAGKSWLLKSFVVKKRKAGSSIVFLRAEDHIVDSLDGLLKSIGTTDFIAALRTYKGPEKYLVIDSLDSLRAESSQRAFRDLIRVVQKEVPELRVVASMRTFDTRQSVEFQVLFPAQDELSTNQLSISCRHFLVPVFSDAELMEVVRSDERLGPILISASSAARVLLRNPFNLWLVIHLLDGGAFIEWISTLQSEAQLLDRYWQFRVDSRSNALARRRVLTALANKMVETNTLSVSLREVTSLEVADPIFKSLLSDEILSKTESDRISFSHNILFDFGVSRLLLDESNIAAFVQAGPARSLFYRPSVTYFLARLWFTDRNSFWATGQAFFEKSPTQLSISAIMPSNVIYDAARTSEDLVPIFALPESKRSRAIVFVLRSVLAFDGFNSVKGRLWQDFLASALSFMNLAFVNEFIALVDIGLNRDVLPTDKVGLANTAVGLLRWLWRNSETASSVSFAQNLSNVAGGRLVPAIVKSYAVIPDAAREVVRDVEKRFGNARASANEAFRVANNIDTVIENDPATAADFFVSVLGFQDKSDQPTNIGSAILPLISNRAQDFSLAHYVLEQKFRLLLTKDFDLAIRTAVRAITAEVNLKEGKTVAQLSAYKNHFEYRGKMASIVSDRSDIWDHSYKDYTSLKLFENVLRAIEYDNLSIDEIRKVIETIAETNIYAVTWKRILTFATHNNKVLSAISELLRIPELLAGPETAFAAGEAIKKACEGNIYQPADLASIETAILSLPKSSMASVYSDPLIVRNQLLGCIPEAMLSDDAKRIVRELREVSGLPPNTPTFKMGPVTYGAMTDEDWLKRQGIETEREENRALLEAVRPLKEFETRFVNNIPSQADCESVIDRLTFADDLLRNDNGAADERVLTDALTNVAAVAAEILKCNDLVKESSIVAKCKAILKFAAKYAYPLTSKDADANFDRPMWSPTPRIEAAQGLMTYVARWGLDSETQSFVEKLSRDVSPAVRFQVASSLIFTYEKDREFFWRLANLSLAEENATGVLVAIARGVAHPHLAKTDRDAVLQWESSLLARTLPIQRTEDILEVTADSLTQLYVYFDDSKARQVLRGFEGAPVKSAFQLSQMALSASRYLAHGIESKNRDEYKIRQRADEIILDVLAAADAAIEQSLKTPSSDQDNEGDGSESSLAKALKTIDSVVFQLYLVLGVNERLVRDGVRPVLVEAARRDLFFELRPIWEKLTKPFSSGNRLLAAQTTHHLMETFSTTLQYDPPYVLRLAADILKAYNWDYAFDSMAKTEIVKFAETILADHKQILREPQNAANLASILDIFVEAGWTEATQLIMKLDSAIR